MMIYAFRFRSMDNGMLVYFVTVHIEEDGLEAHWTSLFGVIRWYNALNDTYRMKEASQKTHSEAGEKINLKPSTTKAYKVFSR